MLAVDTANRQAFELVTSAINTIGRFKRSRDRQLLEGALGDLRAARQHDEQYLLAPYYVAVIEDLLGRSRDAAEQLRALLSETAVDDPGLINEMRFNLAVAQYHGYSHSDLEAAAETLDKVLRDTSAMFNRAKFYLIRLHSLALLAQVHAMWSIPSMPENVTTQKSEPARIKARYEDSVASARKVLFSPALLFLKLLDPIRAREIKAIAYNALGMAAMYYTDFFYESSQKKLERGLKNLKKSDKLFPRDWANYCDIGSCHMRIAYWTNNVAEFDVARKYLTAVVDDLRPNYGFALYEIGRSYRLEKRFDDALKYFERAMKVPKRVREVGDTRVQGQIDLAKDQNADYP